MKIIDDLRFKLGMWLLIDKRMSATAVMMTREMNQLRCEHCGFPVIHYLDDCECKKTRIKR
jgi:hypothetical protein